MMPIPTVESTAAPLPLLVEHGAWIWKALIGLTAVGAPGLVRWRRQRRTAAQVARVVRGATGELRAGPVALRGRLRGAGVRSSRQQVWSYPAPHVTAMRAEDALITVGDVPVRFDGDVEVVAGSRARLDRRAGRTRDGALIAWRQELTVDVGAEVVCVGRLAQGADGAWTLRAAADHRLELYALAHRGAAEPSARTRTAALAVLAGVGMALLLCLLGRAMNGKIHAAARDEDASLADIPLRVQVAAMTPTGRLAAMAWIDGAAENAVGREEIGRALAVARLRGTDLLVPQLRDLDRHDELLALARRRGDDALTFEALTRLARFAEAAEVMPRLPDIERGDAVEVAIAAGRWAEAATRVEAEAQAQPGGPDREAMRCLAAWMHVKSGDGTAGEYLREAAGRSRACKLIVDAIAPTALGGLRQDPEPGFEGERGGAWYRIAGVLTGASVDCGFNRGAAWAVSFVATHLAEMPEADDTRDDDERHSRRAARQGPRCRAAWALIADQRVADPYRLNSDAVYTAELEFDPDRGGIMDADAAVALRRGAFVPADLGLPDRRARSAVLDALERDARPLARYLEHHALARTGQIALGVAPRLRTGQAALADALLWSSLRVSPWPGDWSLIGTILQRALLRRQVLRLLGRDDLAAPDAAIVARVVEVFADRDKVLALAFWSAR